MSLGRLIATLVVASLVGGMLIGGLGHYVGLPSNTAALGALIGGIGGFLMTRRSPTPK